MLATQRGSLENSRFPLPIFPGPKDFNALKTLAYAETMNQLAAKRYQENLSIRYVSGLRNQNFFPFTHIRESCNHPNLYAHWGFEEVASKRVFLDLSLGTV